MLQTNRLLFMIALVSFSWVNLQAQDFELSSKVPVDPSIKTGQLENGLRYYIKKNTKPENRVEMRLALNAGSMMENDNQLGLAHFVEHMCFNGTKNFKKSELVDFLEKAGVKFGAHLNAYTSFDETVYMLQLPTNKPDILAKGYQVLEDWAHNVSFDNEEIDKERGVVIEEWRLGLGANERMRQEYFPVLLKDSRYAERLPIGTLEILKNFKHQTVKDFYNDWYRTDLMAVIIVGDIDIDATEKTIKEHFGKIKNVKKPRKREIYNIPDNNEPLISVVTDKEATYNIIQMFYKHNKEDESTVGAYKKSLSYQLYSGMINQRINELSQKPEASFLFAQSSYGGFLGRTKDAYISFAVPKENKIAEALEMLIAENEKVKLFGFTQTELDRQKKATLAQYEKMANEADKTPSRNLAGEYVRNFLEGEVIPGIALENKYAQKFVPEITLDEINALAKKWITDNNLAIVIMTKEKEGAIVPSEKEVLEIINKAKTKKYEAYVDETSDAPLMPIKLKAVKVISKKENKDFGLTELTFSNNVKVVLKPTDFKNDEILFAAYALGGKSIAPDEDIFAASFMTQVMNQSGFGEFNKIALTKKLAGNTAKFRLTDNEISFGLSGSSSPKDFETLLQLNHQYFTAANKDEDAFKTFISGMENQVKFMAASPEMAFYEKLVSTTSSNNPRAFIFPTIEQLQKISLDKVYDYYNKAYKNAKDYTFFVIGNFDVEKITPLLETYIGSLPTAEINRNWVDRDVKFPKGITEETVHKGKEPKSQVGIVFEGKFNWNQKNYTISKLLLKTLSIKLRESMREDQGGVYGVRSSIELEKYPKASYSIQVSFGCSPDNVTKLVETVFNEMSTIAKNGPTEVDLKKAKETYINDRESKLKENKFWLSYLQASYFNGFDLQSFEAYKKMVNELTIKDLQKAAKNYFTPKHYVKVVLMPEKE